MSKRQNNKKVHRRFDYVCFYTGIQCARPGQKEGLQATVEHILPQSSVKFFNLVHPELSEEERLAIWQLSYFNKVTAASFMNVIVGNAPLKIKYGLKDYLATLTPPNASNQIIKMFYKHRTIEYLHQYKIPSAHNTPYPWFWKSIQNNDILRMKLFEKYVNLLTNEEKKLLELK